MKVRTSLSPRRNKKKKEKEKRKKTKKKSLKKARNRNDVSFFVELKSIISEIYEKLI